MLFLDIVRLFLLSEKCSACTNTIRILANIIKGNNYITSTILNLKKKINNNPAWTVVIIVVHEYKLFVLKS